MENDRFSMKQWMTYSKFLMSACTIIYYGVRTRNEMMAKTISIEKAQSLEQQAIQEKAVQQKTQQNDSINDVIKKSNAHVRFQSSANLFDSSALPILQAGINVQSPTVVYRNLTLKGDLNRNIFPLRTI
jgi:transcription initiation factor TFIID subunit TAF12